MSQEYPDFSPEVEELLKRRYLQENETPDDMFRRVADVVAKAELKYEDGQSNYEEYRNYFYHLTRSLTFLPNSPTLMGAGVSGTLSACFTVPIEDSIGGIFEAVKQCAIITKYGGGVGMSFSRLRPKGAVVSSTKGTSTGPCSFIRVFDTMAESVKQGGRRRGAMLGSLSVHHPDILEFIHLKETEGDLTNYNLSVEITDEFMFAVTNNKGYDLTDPHTGEVVKSLDAREVWEEIVDHAWRNGEPGILFIDTINRENLVQNLGYIETTNPCGEVPMPPFGSCLTGESLVHTSKGLKRMDTVTRGDLVLTLASDGSHVYVPVTAMVNQGKKPVIRLRTRSGLSLRCTTDHRIMTTEGWVEAGRSKGLAVRVQSEPGMVEVGHTTFHEMMGWLTGDGSILPNTVGILFGDDDHEVEDCFASLFLEYAGVTVKPQRRPDHTTQYYTESRQAIRRFLDLGYKPATALDKQVPDSVLYGPTTAHIGYLRGLFGADGTVRDWRKDSPTACEIQLASSSPQLLSHVQVILANLGIQSGQVWSRFSSGRNPQGRICIHGTSAARFIALIGFSVSHKTSRYQTPKHMHGPRLWDPIISVEPDGEEETFDIEVPGPNSFFAQGMLVHNCTLGSINLTRHVTVDEMGDPAIDWEKLTRTTELATRFLDDVLDVNQYPLAEIKARALNDRRIGVGVMGWADTLYLLGIPYDSEEAVSLAHAVMHHIHSEANRTSKSLSHKRGRFPGWGLGMPDRRNATLTVIAPTGSISTIAGVSSGIEPNFALSYTRKTFDKQTIKILNPIYEEFVRNTVQDSTAAERLLEHVCVTGQAHHDGHLQGRNVFVTASEVSPEYHVKMQAAFQSEIDSGVSKTIGMPNSATREDVNIALKLAYELGCKGITVYRDGSRVNQVLTTSAPPADKKLSLKERLLKAGSYIDTDTFAKALGNDAASSSPAGESKFGVHLQNGSIIKADPSTEPMKGVIDEDRPWMDEMTFLTKENLSKKRREFFKWCAEHRSEIDPDYEEKVTKPKDRPSQLEGKTVKQSTGCGNMYITVNYQEDKPFEVFLTMGKSGGCLASQNEALARMVSLALRSGVDVDEVVKQLKDIRCPNPTMGPNGCTSCADALSRTLTSHLQVKNNSDDNGHVTENTVQYERNSSAGYCPDCQRPLVPQEGCLVCPVCSYSRCSG
jgi:ribonucleoside-diphosphate reductase alpha chain